MQLFLDSACLRTLKDLNAWGCIDGVTTNPSLLAPYKAQWKEHVQDLARYLKKPMSVEVVSTDNMVAEGQEIAALHPSMVVKLPCTPGGFHACAQLSTQSIAVNMTLCFSPAQAWLAAKAGATYISPFVGRLEDQGDSGLDLVTDIVHMYRNYQFKTQVLAASIRSTGHVAALLKRGADIVTLPPSLFPEIAQHPLTQKGLEKFSHAWQG